MGGGGENSGLLSFRLPKVTRSFDVHTGRRKKGFVGQVRMRCTLCPPRSVGQNTVTGPHLKPRVSGNMVPS